MRTAIRGRHGFRLAQTLLIMVGLIALNTGCLGPQAIRGTRLKYNEVYRTTSDQQLLLNLVRLRYADIPVLIDLPTITGQFEAGAAGGYNSPVSIGTDPGIPGFGIGELILRDTPTLSYQPRSGQELARTLITPLTADVLRVISPGSNTETFLRMAVDDINDIPNAPLATSLIPRIPDDNSHFRQVIALLVGMQERGAVELSTAAYEVESFDPIPLEKLEAKDLIDAAEKGFRFQTTSDTATLKRVEKAVVLRIQPSDQFAPDVVGFTQLLGLEPGRGYYKVVAEQSQEESPDSIPDPLANNEISVHMRSLLEIMTYLSKGVQVPEDHIIHGVAPVTRNGDGTIFCWDNLSAGLFQVQCQKHKPHDAEVSVEYRGYWYYIPTRDIPTRSTFAMLELLLELQETEKGQTGPLLTLPLN